VIELAGHQGTQTRHALLLAINGHPFAMSAHGGKDAGVRQGDGPG
jgi:hypothetical protein